MLDLVTTAEAPRALSSEELIRALYTIAAQPAVPFEEQARRILQLGLDYLDLDIGIIARIDGERYEVVHTVGPDGMRLRPGDAFDVGMTYCSQVLDANGPVWYEHAGTTEFACHPAYQAYKVEAYAGVRLHVGDEPFGTLSFSSLTPRPHRFRPDDLDALQLLANWLGGEMHRRRAKAEREQLIADLETTVMRLRRLEGLIAVCSWCRKGRDERTWLHIETYLERYADAAFSHGICPACADAFDAD